MTTIATNATAYNNPALLLTPDSTGRTPSEVGLTRPDTAAAVPRDPVDSVDLSDRAKAILARAKSEQAAVGELASQIEAARNTAQSASKPGQALKSNVDPISLFGRLSGLTSPEDSESLTTRIATWAPTVTATVTVRDGAAPYGDSTTTDAQFIKDMGLDYSITAQADQLDSRGAPPEIAQGWRNALASGTLKIQNADDVPDLNMHSTQIYFPSAVGGPSAWGTTSQNPTGATKQALDEGRALAVWTADRGNVYISW